MSEFLVKFFGVFGKVYDIKVENVKGLKFLYWNYVGFGFYCLKVGESVLEMIGDCEVILVMVEGKVEIFVGGENFGM